MKMLVLRAKGNGFAQCGTNEAECQTRCELGL